MKCQSSRVLVTDLLLNKLEKNHLKLGDTTYRPDFMKGSILEQNYKGNKILPGTKLRWGSAVSLVIGGGLVEQQIRVPDLLGLTVSEARAELQAKGLRWPRYSPAATVTDTLNAYIVKQNPDVLDEEQNPVYIRPGQTMDIWVSAGSSGDMTVQI